MDEPRPEKVAIVDEVRGRFDASSAALVTEYRGLNVHAMQELRRSLRAAGGEYKIYKNTLVRFAARDAGISGFDDLLTGPTAIAFVEGDAAAVAKALRDYARTNPHLVVKGGLLGRKVLSASDVTALADLPPREVVLAQLAGALAAPMRQFAGLLKALPQNFAYGLKALIEAKGGVAAHDTAGVAAPDPAGGPAAADDTTEVAAEAAEPEPAAAAPAADEPAQES